MQTQVNNQRFFVVFPAKILFLGALLIGTFVLWNRTFAQETVPLPAAWLTEWNAPSNIMRPLQIIHGRDLSDPATVEYYKNCGLGGVVINVSGDGYIPTAPENSAPGLISKHYVSNPQNWERFVQGVKNVDAAGLRFWIYDEDGYPSLGAGGIVLEGHPELESQELVYDPEHDPPCYVRDSYEFTHASNNYCEQRRYPNPLNPKAVERFIEVTHKQYKEKLGEGLYAKAEAFFTDEPSMMAMYLGRIPAEISVRDPQNPDKKQLPAVPWCDDMESKYQEKYGESLHDHLMSLFTGDSEADRQIRRQFWTLVNELDIARYYQPIKTWCRSAQPGPVASGHSLWEEVLVAHVGLDGDKLEVLKNYDIPGLDILNADPMAYLNGEWCVAAFPCSAATLIGERRVMTETSDFSQSFGGNPMVKLPLMEASSAWQAIWGVTDFNLYYSIQGGTISPWRNEQTHREYCDFIGRLNSILRDATPIRPLLFYYPIDVLQEEYRPVAETIGSGKQSDRMIQTINDWRRVGTLMARNQIPFTLINTKSIEQLLRNDSTKQEKTARAQTSDKQLSPADFTGLVLSQNARVNDENWLNPGFRTVRADDISEEELLTKLEPLTGPRLKWSHAFMKLCAGTFKRDGRLIFVVTNLTPEPYEGTAGLINLAKDPAQRWTLLNPQTGDVRSDVDPTAAPVTIAPYETLIWVYGD